MRCEEFLEGYSEFVDGMLPEALHEAFEAHLDCCTTCGRYHRVVQRGLFVYRNLPALRPSPDFTPRLKHRLYHVEDEIRSAGRSPVGSAALVAVAAVGLLAVAWLPVASRFSVEVELPPVAVELPAGDELPSLFGPGPFVRPRTTGYTIPAADWEYAASSMRWNGPAPVGWWQVPLVTGGAAWFRAPTPDPDRRALPPDGSSAR